MNRIFALLAATIALAWSPLVTAQTTDTTTPLIWVEFDVDKTPSLLDNGQTVDYVDQCIVLPEVNNRQNRQVISTSSNNNGLSGPGRLMRRDSSGTVTTLFDCEALGRICMPADPRLSFDGTKVAFTLYTGTAWHNKCNSLNKTLSGTDAGAHIAVHDLQTSTTTEWPAVPGQHDVTPVFVNQNGTTKIMFSSDRSVEYAPSVAHTSPGGVLDYRNLQTYIADIDGTNVVKTGYHDFTAAYGGWQMVDGRVFYSCAQWTHDLPYRNTGIVYSNHPSTLLNMWWMCGSDPYGGSIESIYGAHYTGKALHWTNQMSDGRLMFGEYYRGNFQNGAGKIWLMSPQPFTIEGKPSNEWAHANDILTPRDLLDVAPWATSEDSRGVFNTTHNEWQGRIRDPIGLPNGELGFVWCRGTCNTQSSSPGDNMDELIEGGPNRIPGLVANPIAAELGIYKLPSNKIPSTDYKNDPVLMVDQPNVAEYGAIYGGPYIDVYGQARPDDVAQPLSGNGNCYLHIASQQSDTTNIDVINGVWRWGWNDLTGKHGKELTGVTDADVKYIRLTEAIPNTRKQTNFSGLGQELWSAWGYRGQNLGEAPVEADGSANIEIPCDTPWVLQGLNEDREVIKRDMMVQSLRPGTVLECGGCHLHNDVDAQPVFGSSVAAGKAPSQLENPRPVYEYSTHVVPIINNRCASCHNGGSAQAGLDLNDGATTRAMLLEDFEQLLNPAPVAVSGPADGVNNPPSQLYLDRPLLSAFVHGSYAAGSPLYWYFKGERADYRTNASSTADMDFNEAHPAVNATPQEIQVIRDWIDTGSYFDPAIAIQPYSGLTLFAPVDDVYNLLTGQSLTDGVATTPAPSDPDLTPQQPAGFATVPTSPGATGGGPNGSWAWFGGTWAISGESYYDDHAQDMYWGYSRTDPVPTSMRLLVHLHGSSAGTGAGMQSSFAPPKANLNQIMLQNPDAEAYNGAWREWWAFDESGNPFPGRRIAGSIEVLAARYPQIDFINKGIVLKGGSMGGGGAVLQSMILPDPWRAQVAYVTSSVGGVLPREHAGNYAAVWPADSGAGAAFWDSVDFAIQAVSDSVVRNQHYRHRFSSNDGFWGLGPLKFLNICETQKVSCVASWVQNGHNAGEPGVAAMTNENPYEDDPNSDVTLDRAYPAFTNSTGNYPLTAQDRLDTATYPRGHYNLGITWHTANTVDTSAEVIIPIKYAARTSIGGGIPDQPASITVSVTPRRAKNFVVANGETINWSWDGGAASGTVVVANGEVTVDNIPLTSGDDYKNIRFYK